MDKKNLVLRVTAGISLAIFIFYFSFQIGKFYKRDKLFPGLKEEIIQIFQNQGLQYSIAIKDLSFPGLQYNRNSNEKIAAASLIKLPILAAALNAVQTKKISLQTEVTVKASDVTGGSGKLKAESFPKRLILKELLELMISASDNTATNKVIDILGFPYINDCFRAFGLEVTQLKRKMMDFSQRKKGVENYTSSRDIGLILEQIYNKKLVSRELSGLALKLLKKQTVNDRLPRYLPESVEIAHKTGLERGIIHDAGIVFAPVGDYIICVLLEGVKNYKKAKKSIAQTSLFTYNLYQ